MSQALVWCSVVFLSTPSARRATTFRDPLPLGHGDFYPRPPRGGRPMLFILSAGQKISIHGIRQAQAISIHALREEGDLADLPDEQREYIISIHALREEGDDLSREVFVDELDFYPRPPRGGRLECIGPRHGAKKISIHALREEGDGHRQGSGAGAGHFYPRPPRGGRRSSPPPGHRWSRYFYPRPPRGGRRLRSLSNLLSHLQNFYPRPPRGGRLQLDRYCAVCQRFLSTPSARRATHIVQT